MEQQKIDNPRVRLTTSLGEFVLDLNREKAPVTVENFLRYVDDRFYDGTIFHRVIDGFMIQGGGYDEKLGRKETRPPIQNEAHNGLRNVRGTIAMARLPEPDTATSQFFINVGDNSESLDYRDDIERPGYCVFGEVTDGMDTVDRIKQVETGMNAIGEDAPIEKVTILSARREEPA
ncbi:MAG: peptidyl-prolyl cis-trans isomerase [Candidatus Eisenbacteria bacterium]|nr:peptidyl-prolyl cis-trans isomerase [Candidatus Eisenbacteria bacterium]